MVKAGARDGTSLSELTRSTSLVNHATGHQPRFGAVSLGRRVRHWLDATPAGLALDLLSSGLSILVISVYIVATYLPAGSSAYNQLRYVELACCCWFAVEWLLRLWTANDRLRYLVSLQSLVDLVTVVPLFLIYIWDAADARGTQGIDFFLALVRFLRVLRIFRLFQLGSRVSSEVNSRLMALACTLISLIMISASLFLEIETTYGDKYPDLHYHEAIYWSVVTATTIGYGDYSPSTPASQMALLGMLLVTFTLLPYQTSMLVTAMGYSSGYQRASYSAAAHGRHVLLLGPLHAARLRTLLEQLFHPDYGFQDHQVVLLNREAPGEELRHVLKHHPNSHRLFYIQGDPFHHMALQRAQAAIADAIFVFTPEAAPDPATTDLQALMLLLSLGHAVQRHQLQMSNKTPRPIAAQLMAAVWWLLRWLQPGKHNTAIPRVYLQLALPASQQHAQQLLASMSSCREPGDAARPLAEGCEGAAANRGMMDIAEEEHSRASRVQPGGGGGGGGGGGRGGAAAAMPGVVLSKQRSWRQWCRMLLTGSFLQRQSPGDSSFPSLKRQASGVGGFWHTFASGVTVMSRLEVRASLLGLAATGGCAVLPLLSNLVRSVDAGDMTEQEFKALPEWLQQYMEGSAMELYEVAAFPAHLVGRPFTTVARYLLDVHHALLLALVPSGQGRKGAAGAGRHCLLAPVAQSVTLDCRGYIIASDLRVAADIAEADVRVFQHWCAEWLQPPEDLIQADILLEQQLLQQEANGAISPAERVAAVKGEASLDGSDSESSVASYAAGDVFAAGQPGSTGLLPSEGGSRLSTSGFTPARPPLPSRPSGRSLSHCASSMPHPAAVSSQGSLVRPSMKYTAPSVPRASSRTQLLGPLGVPGQHSMRGVSQSSPGRRRSSQGNSPRATAEDTTPHAVWVEDESGAMVAAADTVSSVGSQVLPPGPASSRLTNPGDSPPGGLSMGRSSMLSSLASSTGRALVSPLLAAAAALSTGGGSTAAAGGALRKRHRSSCLCHSSSDTAFLQAWGGPGLGEANAQQPLDTGLSWAPTTVDQLQHLYHTRPCTGEEQLQVHQVDACTWTGHVVVVLGPAPLCSGEVFSLLAPMRSRSFLEVQPVVLLSQEPLQGPEWAAVARLKDVMVVQGIPSSFRDLARANLAAAELALVMPSLPQGSGLPEEEPAVQHRHDMEVAAVVHLLKTAAPGCRVVTCLHCPSRALWLDPTGWLLEWQPEEGTCQALPAAMCGRVLLPQLLDCTLCQTHFNGFTWQLMQQLLVSWHSRAAFSSKHASGARRTAATPDPTVTGRQQPQPLHAADSSRGAALLQLPVLWPGWVYGDLFTHLLCERGWLPLALYRSAAHRGCQVPYVYTNPSRHTLLQEGDQVVVLVPLDPDTGQLPKEALLALHAQHHSTSDSTLHPPDAAAGSVPGEDGEGASGNALEGHPQASAARSRWQSAARRVLTKLRADGKIPLDVGAGQELHG